jgi:TrmH family RNA methyltransferase
VITNPRAGQIRKAAQLRRKKERLATGRFLVEGPHAVSEALRFIPERVLLIYTTLRARAEHPEIDRHAAQSQTEVVVATDEVLAELSDTVTPQGVIAVVQLLEQSLSAIPLSAKAGCGA